MIITKPLVSIQIPTYNQKDFIKEAVNSALMQTYDNIEIIVIDDCTAAYNIFDVLHEFIDNPKIKIYRNEKNLGRVQNYRFSLFNLVKGEWFMNLDGDDFFINRYFIQNAIENIILAGVENVVMYKGNTVMKNFFKSQINYRKLSTDNYVVRNEDFLSKIQFDYGFTHSSQLYNVKKAKEADFYNRNLLDADYFSYLKILRNGYTIFAEEPVYHWRQHANQATHTVTTEQVLKRFDAINELNSIFSNSGNSGVHAVNYTRKMVYIYLLIVASQQKNLLKNLPTIIKKTKMELSYIIPLLSTLKNYYFPRKKS